MQSLRTTRSAVVFALLTTFFTVDRTPAQQNVLTLENSTLAVRFDRGAGTFTIAAKPTGRVFLRDGRFSAGDGAARVVAVTDKTLGAGETIEIVRTGGGRDTIMLFSSLPFALLRSTLTNAARDATITRRVHPFTAAIDLGVPSTSLKTLGTGGLLSPDRNPGSYVWLAVAEPQTRRGVVAGWLTEDRGSGVVFTRVTGDEVRLEPRIDYGRLRLEPGQQEPLETFAVGFFDDARLGLESWADAVARVYSIHLHPQPTGYCTWYSRPHGGASDETRLAPLAAFAATNLAPFGFSVVQIDDGWQDGQSTNGPRRNFTTARPTGPYRSGMKAAADQIKSLGLTPGIWFMPFAGTYYDPFFAPHEDWFVKRTNGAPFETAWGGTCLDMTNPGAREHLRRTVSRIAHEWGFDYFKMDGLWTGTGTRQQYINTGYKDDGIGDAIFHDPRKTNLEAYRDGLRLVREAAGPRVFFLGCCAPQNMRSYGGAFGLVDAMRIGPDNGAEWKSLLRGPTFGSRHYFLHGRVWYNDPDPVYVRTNLPLAHARLICSWVALSGQLNLSSEWLPGLPPERLEILRRTMPAHGLRSRPVDLFENDPPRIWLLTDEREGERRDVVGLFNWTNTERDFDLPLESLGLPTAEYAGFDFWNNAPLAPVKDGLHLAVPAQSCRVVTLRAAVPRPQLISSSRHVTQGVVDVREEKWDAARATLSGRSDVVGRDPYEMRVALPAGSTVTWRLASASVAPEDATAGVSIAPVPGADITRVRVLSLANRAVRWQLQFASQR